MFREKYFAFVASSQGNCERSFGLNRPSATVTGQDGACLYPKARVYWTNTGLLHFKEIGQTLEPVAQDGDYQ